LEAELDSLFIEDVKRLVDVPNTNDKKPIKKLKRSKKVLKKKKAQRVTKKKTISKRKFTIKDYIALRARESEIEFERKAKREFKEEPKVKSEIESEKIVEPERIVKDEGAIEFEEIPRPEVTQESESPNYRNLDKMREELSLIFDFDALASFSSKPKILNSLVIQNDFAFFSDMDQEMINRVYKEASNCLLLKFKDSELLMKDVWTLKTMPVGNPYFDLFKRLEELAIEYDIEIYIVHKIFKEVNGNLDELEKALKGEVVERWNNFEDIVLEHPEDENLYSLLLEHKGEDKIQKRKEFLNFFKIEPAK